MYRERVSSTYYAAVSETIKIHALEHLSIPDAISLLAMPTQHIYSDAVNKRLNLNHIAKLKAL
ncbi:21928_t:CDS:2 [Entrophospora sp. SA101]|nr:21928_t:CDS:2 [Entrophospora sp. SA101]CAJ0849441.1 1411_t:CDS:2 [Entrophospora sp. SA101]CAJ0855893.1 15027_t:CDS:2 [Entrophospora sp. SA101]